MELLVNHRLNGHGRNDCHLDLCPDLVPVLAGMVGPNRLLISDDGSEPIRGFRLWESRNRDGLNQDLCHFSLDCDWDYYGDYAL